MQANDIRANQLDACLRGNIIRAETNISRVYIQRVANGVLEIVDTTNIPDPTGEVQSSVKQLRDISDNIPAIKYIDCRAIYE